MPFDDEMYIAARDNPAGTNAQDDAPLSSLTPSRRVVPSVIDMAHALNRALAPLNLGGTSASVEQLLGRGLEGTARGKRMLENSHEGTTGADSGEAA